MTDADATCPVHADRATLSIVASEELPADYASCVHCVEGLRELRELRALGDSLAWAPPDADHSARVRARVVESLSSRAGRARHPLFGRFIPATLGLAAAFSAVFLVFVATRHETREPTRGVSTEASLAVVRQVGVARFEEIGKAPDEVVRLEEGRVHVSVAHLGPAERFRLVTGDAVVEVRGTEFDVEASQSHLEAVAVQRGRVEVRVDAREPALLTEGGRWSANEHPAAPPPAPAPARAAHIAESAVHRKEAVPSAHAPAAARESTAAEIPPSPPAAPSPAEEIPAHREVNLPATPPKSVVTAPAKPPEVIGVESQRREREEQRSERRERRDERRLEHLERRR
jgi:hypothetical protein